MVWRSILFNPGLYKIFDEIVVNALDHVTRQSGSGSGRVSEITFRIKPTEFSVRNDGEGIPVEMHPEYKVMAPELIFGHLLTSTNYDDSEEKVVGGKNGYGAKLTNIHSLEFTVRTCDRKSLYEQTFRTNMSDVGAPAIRKVTGAHAKPFTEIRSVPDLARFFGPGATEIPADMRDVLRTRVVQAAALVASRGCVVLMAFGDEKLSAVSVPSFEALARLFTHDSPTFYERTDPRWEVVAVLTNHLHADSVPENRHVSFVNGIYTSRGGKHLDAVASEILGKFCAGPGAKLGLKAAQIKDAVTFFVNATIVNPSFDSQSKDTLMTPAAKFGSKFTISDAFVKRLAKEGGLLAEATAVLEARMGREAKKTDGKRVARVIDIPKLDDALWAGDVKKSIECSLIVTEGDSAKTLAISGLSVVGREKYGVYPLKGKSLNVRDASQQAINDNVEVANIKKIIGLRVGFKYTTLVGVGLRYGRLKIMADQDVDGSHIKGLIINMFHVQWPELLKLGFVECIMTPLIKASKGGSRVVREFYSAPQYDAWMASDEAKGGRGWAIKYYKGLGTSVAAEARDYFKSMNLVRFTWDDAADESIDRAFRKDRADDRKTWLGTYDRDRVLDVPAGGADVTYTQFMNDEFIHYSDESNKRGIPHVMDGQKPSQRKILWAARKRNLTGTEIKVAQLAGYVSEHAAYHHGEASLNGTIVGMAQDFVGSNNINLLEPRGQFGTRLLGGKDSAAERYIFTLLAPIQSTLFVRADDADLAWMTDDGQTVEPTYYLPVVPLLLVNGAEGMGTGYSTNIPSFNPADLVAALRLRLEGDVEDLTDRALIPWWDGFKGTVVRVPGKTVAGGPPKMDSFRTRGVYEFLDETHQVRITELPIGTWTMAYKKFLDDMILEEEEEEEKAKIAAKKAEEAALATRAAATMVATAKAKAKGSATVSTAAVAVVVAPASITSTGKAAAAAGKPVKRCLREVAPLYNDVDAAFLLTLDEDAYCEFRGNTSAAEFEKKFKLTSPVSLTNMVAWDTDGTLRQFASPGEILETFYVRRLAGYVARKEHEMARLETERVELDAKVRFVKAVVAEELTVSNAADADLLAGLRALDLPPLSTPDVDEDDVTLRGFEYLLSMRVDRLKAKAVVELEGKLAAIEEESAALEAQTPEELWLADLEVFVESYESFAKARTVSRAEAAAAGMAEVKPKVKAKKGVKV